jgi:predicted DNA-binding transcriptional regulator AlpA
MANADPEQRMWARDAAAYLRLSRSTLAKWRMKGEGPPFHRCGRRLIYYLKGEIDAWLASCDRFATEAEGP